MSKANKRPGWPTCFSYWPERHKVGREPESLLPAKCCWILFSGFRGEVENVSPHQMPGQPSCFFNWPEKNTNLVGDVKILLPVKFCWIPFRGFRGEVENVSVNQRPGWPSCFSTVPKNTNLVEDFEILLPVKFCWIPFRGFRGKVENVRDYTRRRTDDMVPTDHDIPFSRTFQGLLRYIFKDFSRTFLCSFKLQFAKKRSSIMDFLNKTYRDHLIFNSPEKWWGGGEIWVCVFIFFRRFAVLWL